MPPAIPTITISSSLGAAAVVFTAEEPTTVLGLEVFVLLWAAQFVTWGVWIAETANEGFIRIYGAFHREYLIVTSPQALGEVLVSKAYEFEKPPTIRGFFGPVLGHGLVLAEGHDHKVQRRNLMPAFAFRHIKDLYPLFWRKTCDVVQVMTKECDADGYAEFEVGHWASRVSLDIIGVAGLGRDFNATHDEDDEIVKTYMLITTPTMQDRLLLVMADFLTAFVPMSILLQSPIPRAIEAKGAAKKIHDVCKDVIRLKKQKLADSKLEDVDILSIALRSGMFSEEELINHMMTFLGAGHETTASALSFAIYAMCRHPEVQTRLRQEVRANLPPPVGDDGREITSMEIDRLPYLAAVCSEVLRMYSPVPQTIRETVRDTTIQGQPLPRGTRLLLVPWATNLDTRFWGPDGGEFKPERWLVARGGGDDEHDGLGGTAASVKAASVGGASSNHVFLSFLHGPRSCIGQSFAKAEFACLLAAWVGRFEFTLRDEAMMDEANVMFEQMVTAKVAGGIHVRARAVPGW
ncbi:Taurochenodeoxycholic 6 alpha-hydroxylase [Beauveria bassiana D1-5]|uniref:Taurochenodeoxycholic 6 alpha-hydroxylase n=1 Tax=Beauveria bassiana D1-5 TaxID=1245745 RepID=A0A0A2VIA5_BEABA|nr:Taurochenodeoxycholic 6 alpha-hydroxylase [Beauveria bassiana D1-5]